MSMPGPRITRIFLTLVSGFWSGPGGKRAYALTLLVGVTMLCQIGIQLGANGWNRMFFDSLQHRDRASLWFYGFALIPLVAAGTLASSSNAYWKATLQTRWRAWVNGVLLTRWVSQQRYYRLQIVAPQLSAPEFRIAEDVRLSLEPIVDFTIGVLTATITAASFSAILWEVAGSATIRAFGTTIIVPAYMALACVCYAILTSTGAYFVGRPLVLRVASRSQAEADYRADMTRLRENAESAALIRGDQDELKALSRRYGAVLGAWLAVIRQQFWVMLVLATNTALLPVVPLLLAAPKFLSGDITIGAVVQLSTAFVAVQGSLVWFADNIGRLAEWRASAVRVVELSRKLDDTDIHIQDANANIAFAPSEDSDIHIRDLKIEDRESRVLIKPFSLVIAPGEKILVGGENGSGKSTMMRAVAGLWPWGSGAVNLPTGLRAEFVPQRSHVPKGTLRHAVLYPNSSVEISTDRIAWALTMTGLEPFITKLDAPFIDWSTTLSGGERQRLAFARLLLHRPDIVILDEATSALDEASQHSVLTLLRTELAGMTVISMGHRAELDLYHDRKFVIRNRVLAPDRDFKPAAKALTVDAL
jgi:vitamin B12/bleomycin/antimicrobial peptide transport system ATP-binding/permease protein